MIRIKPSIDLIKLCLEELDSRSGSLQKYKNYYTDDHDILKNYDMQDSRSNKKLVFNFPRKFVDNETGYLLGKPVNFVSKSDNEEAVACIDKNTAHWDKEHSINLRKQSEIDGESYELNYVSTEGEFCATCLTPLECFVLEDGTAQRTAVLALQTPTAKADFPMCFL